MPWRNSLSLLSFSFAAAVLAGCGHVGGAPSAPVEAPLNVQSVAFMTTMPATENVGAGQMYNGLQDTFSPHDGDSTTGGHGPLNSTLDGIQCASTMADSGYHIHFFLGIVRNGQQYALPDGIGFANPSGHEITYGVPNQEEYVVPPPGQTQGCYYRVHTHDSSGVIHVELPNPTGTLKVQNSYVKLGQLLAIWGHRVTSSSFDTLGGPVRVVTSGQRYQGGTSTGRISNTTYTYYGLDLNQIPIYSHEVIWLLVGSGNPAPQQLPSIVYYEEY